MPNIKRKISQHNRKVLQPVSQQDQIQHCNCRNPPCPLNGACASTKSVVYKATVYEKNNNNNSTNIETYTGLTKNTFKQRYNGHKSSFRKRKKEHATTLSTHIWKLKDSGSDFEVKWSIIEKGRKFDPTTRMHALFKRKVSYYLQPRWFHPESKI